MNVKLEKTEQTIMREISDILRKHAADRYLQEITITGVEVSNDMSVAKVYYTVFKPEDMEHVVRSLKHGVGFVRTELAKVADLKKVPELRFEYDKSIEYGEKIEAVIKELESKDIA